MNHREFLNRRVYRHFMRGDLSGAAHLGMSSTARYIRRYERERGGETGEDALARSGGVCYNSHRCAAMGGKIPATRQNKNGIKNHFPACTMPRASRAVSYHCMGGVFRKRR